MDVEPLLANSQEHFVLFPIRYPDVQLQLSPSEMTRTPNILPDLGHV